MEFCRKSMSLWDLICLVCLVCLDLFGVLGKRQSAWSLSEASSWIFTSSRKQRLRPHVRSRTARTWKPSLPKRAFPPALKPSIQMGFRAPFSCYKNLSGTLTCIEKEFILSFGTDSHLAEFIPRIYVLELSWTILNYCVVLLTFFDFDFATWCNSMIWNRTTQSPYQEDASA